MDLKELKQLMVQKKDLNDNTNEIEEIKEEIKVINKKIDLLTDYIMLNNKKDKDKKVKKYKEPGAFSKFIYKLFDFIKLIIIKPGNLINFIISLPKLKIKLIRERVVLLCYIKFGKIKIKHEKNPVVSIIIPVYNQFYCTYQCIKRIEETAEDIPYEIILVDDVSTDSTRKFKNFVKNITIIRNKENLGFLKNCNKASKLARGKYICLLNNDTIPQQGWLSNLINLAENDPTIGLVGSKLLCANGKLQEAGAIITKEGFIYNYGRDDSPDKPEYNYVRDVDYISGCSILIKKEIWDDIGGFDERYCPAYCEDCDIAFEIRKRGYRVVYQPKSVVVHLEGVSNGNNESDISSIKHYQLINQKKLAEKWKNEFDLLPSNRTEQLNFKFRDRFNNKKVILVIDQGVPEYDKDAGSKCTFNYLKLFVDKGFHVKFLGDNYCKEEPYTSKLQQMGIEVLYGNYYQQNIEKFIIENKDNIDIAYLNRPNISIKYINLLRNKTKIKLLYFGHDLHFLRESREFEITGDINMYNNSKDWKDIEFYIMNNVDKVYYPSEIETKIIKNIDPKIDAKAINLYAFDNLEKNLKINFEQNKGMLFVGGFRHRPNVDAVQWFVQYVYPIIKAKKDIPLYIVGSHAPESILDLNKIDGINVLGYISDEELDNLYKSVKLTVIPLRYGAGIKGKVLEAMSKGSPLITTDIGAEGIIGINEICQITNDSEEFAQIIINLYDDNQKLYDISNKEKDFIQNKFSTEAAWNIIKNDF